MSLADRLIDRAQARAPDVVIGGHADPYLLRYFLIPRNRIFNVYLHHFLRSDDDRALHCHPWVSLSILLRGGYIEHTLDMAGVQVWQHLRKGDWRFRWSGRIAHRIELLTVGGDDVLEQHEDQTPASCWTLFVTGPRYRQWGFLCPQGWRHWQEFTSPLDSGVTGRGCE